MLTLGDWAIVEAEFDQAEPAIYLLKKETVDWKIRGDWGGTPAPHKANPMIRRWLSKDAPDAPRDLVKCFEAIPAR
jgi:hypothetical protein